MWAGRSAGEQRAGAAGRGRRPARARAGGHARRPPAPVGHPRGQGSSRQACSTAVCLKAITAPLRHNSRPCGGPATPEPRPARPRLPPPCPIASLPLPAPLHLCRNRGLRQPAGATAGRQGRRQRDTQPLPPASPDNSALPRPLPTHNFSCPTFATLPASLSPPSAPARPRLAPASPPRPRPVTMRPSVPLLAALLLTGEEGLHRADAAGGRVSGWQGGPGCHRWAPTCSTRPRAGAMLRSRERLLAVRGGFQLGGRHRRGRNTKTDAPPPPQWGLPAPATCRASAGAPLPLTPPPPPFPRTSWQRRGPPPS